MTNLRLRRHPKMRPPPALRVTQLARLGNPLRMMGRPPGLSGVRMQHHLGLRKVQTRYVTNMSVLFTHNYMPLVLTVGCALKERSTAPLPLHHAYYYAGWANWR